MSVLAIIPARAGSKGIPNKNFKHLAGMSPYERAVHVAIEAGVPTIATSTDWVVDTRVWVKPIEKRVMLHWLQRPDELAQDDTPMVDVVKHVLAEIPGPPDQIVVLLQPTQPLRQAKHVTAAIELLRESGADSVVSVVPIPATHHPEYVLEIRRGRLRAWLPGHDVDSAPTTRQSVEPVYIRDGTVYAARRATIERYGLYGSDVRALIIDPSETCPLDSPEDWQEAERRLKERI